MKEKEIRDVAVLKKYLKLVEKDVKLIFKKSDFLKIACPACGGKRFENEFQKIGFQYVTCKCCQSLFVNPRPAPEALKKFYADSQSSKFWINTFFAPFAQARRKKIFKPRAEYISNLLNRNTKLNILEAGAGFGFFLTELRRLLPGNQYFAVEPSVEMAKICREKGIDVKIEFFEDSHFNQKFDLVASFELMEHLFAPEVFLRKARDILKTKGRVFLTTLNNKGFDIQLIWEKSKSIFPPHHLNFFNPLSIRILLERTGFEVDAISTPGKLDWNIVEEAIKNGKVSFGRFWDTLAKEGTDASKNELQGWIAKNNFSSHMMVLAKKAL